MPEFTIDTVNIEYKDMKVYDSKTPTKYEYLYFNFSSSKRLSKSLLRKLRTNKEFQKYIASSIREAMYNINDEMFEYIKEITNKESKLLSSPSDFYISYENNQMIVSDLLFSKFRDGFQTREDLNAYIQKVTQLPMILLVL